MTYESEQIAEMIGLRGFFAMVQSSGTLICGSKRMSTGRLHGNTFAVNFRGSNWWIETWAPVYYSVPAPVMIEELTEICITLLRSSANGVARFNDEIVDGLGLSVFSCEEYMTIFLEDEASLALRSLQDAQQRYCDRFGKYAATIKQLNKAGAFRIRSNLGFLPKGFEITIKQDGDTWSGVACSAQDARVFEVGPQGKVHKSEERGEGSL